MQDSTREETTRGAQTGAGGANRGPSRSRAVSVGEYVLVAASVALLLSSLVLITVVARNPFFLDRVILGLILFVLVPLVLGVGVGALVAVIVRRTAAARAGSPGTRSRSRKPAAFLCIALVVSVAVTLGAWGLAGSFERRSPNPPLKLLLVVIDGADWDVAEKLIDEGRMPNLARAIESGSSGVLLSRDPLYSPIIYTSIASGKVADKHGIRGPQDHSSEAVLVERLWDILNAQLGWTYGVMEWHVTCPPHVRGRGFMVPGWLAMSNETVPHDLEFFKKVRRSGRPGRAPRGIDQIGVAAAAAVHGARLSTLAGMAKIAAVDRFGTENSLSLNLRKHRSLVRFLTEVTRHEIRRTDVDMLAIAYTSTDAVSHRLWRYHEPSLFPDTDPEAVERYGSAVSDMYAAVDRQIGLLTPYLAPDGMLVILSDHGFQAVVQPYPEGRLLRTGVLLDLLDLSQNDVTYFVQGAGAFLRPVTLDEEENAAMRRSLARRCSSLVVAGSNAPAFRVKDVDRPGTGDDHVRIAATRAFLRSALTDDRIAEPGGRDVAAANLLAVFANTGWHAFDGIVVAAGRPFRRGARIDDASVLDVTPTILAALGLPVADDMDGMVIADALTDSFLSAHPVSAIDTYEPEETRARRPLAPEPIPEELRDRLRALGYID